MMFPKTYAFVDEYGDPSLETGKEGVTTHFIVSVILVKDDELANARLLAESLRGKHFQSGEMKSSNVGSNEERRLQILQGINELPISVYAFVVDKREIFKNSGLIFKKPFLKFLCGKVYQKIFKTFPNIEVFADEHGTREFMEGFEKYVRVNHFPSLFESSKFSFQKSKSEALIQTADFVSGSLARVFDEKKKSANAAKILESIRGRITSIDEWPPRYHQLSETISSIVSKDHDSKVRDFCFHSVSLCLEELTDSYDDNVREAVLQYLADQSRDPEHDRYVSAQELIDHLAEMGFKDLNLNFIRSKVIAHFRDHNVIIASNSAGYKVPTSVDDIVSYAHQCNRVATPILLRLKHARDQISMMSHNELDILSNESFSHLREVLKVIQPATSIL